jgi:type I restriction enzyme S subunit
MNNIDYTGRLDLTSLKWIELADDEFDKFTVRRGDLLFNRTNSPELVGKTAVWDKDEAFAFAGYLVRVRVDATKALPEYVSAFLNSPFGKRMLIARAKPSINMSNISAPDLLRFEIPLPGIADQRRISAVLDKVDAIRRKKQESTSLADLLIKATFFDMFGDPVSNTRSWPLLPLAKLGRVTTGNTPSKAHPEYFGKHIEWIKSDNINTPHHFLTQATEGLSVEGRKSGRIVPPGSTLVTCIAGSPECIGNSAIADREVAFNQQINAVTPHDGVDPYFLYALILTSKRLIQLGSSEAMKGMVSKSKFEEVKVIDVPHRLQAEFGRRFVKLVGHSKKLRQASAFSDELFHSLVQRAFRGEFW